MNFASLIVGERIACTTSLIEYYSLFLLRLPSILEHKPLQEIKYLNVSWLLLSFSRNFLYILLFSSRMVIEGSRVVRCTYLFVSLSKLRFLLL